MNRGQWASMLRVNNRASLLLLGIIGLMPATSRGRAYGSTYRLNNLHDEEAVSRGRRRRQQRAACARLHYTTLHYTTSRTEPLPNPTLQQSIKTKT